MDSTDRSDDSVYDGGTAERSELILVSASALTISLRLPSRATEIALTTGGLNPPLSPLDNSTDGSVVIPWPSDVSIRAFEMFERARDIAAVGWPTAAALDTGNCFDTEFCCCPGGLRISSPAMLLASRVIWAASCCTCLQADEPDRVRSGRAPSAGDGVEPDVDDREGVDEGEEGGVEEGVGDRSRPLCTCNEAIDVRGRSISL